MVLISLIISIYISSLVFYFPGHSPLISGPKMAENPNILSIMAAEGLENTIKVKVINLKRDPDNSGDDYQLGEEYVSPKLTSAFFFAFFLFCCWFFVFFCCCCCFFGCVFCFCVLISECFSFFVVFLSNYLPQG